MRPPPTRLLRSQHLHAVGMVSAHAWQLRPGPQLLGVEACVSTRHFTDDVVQDPLCDGTEELVAGHRLDASRIQDPGVEVDAG